ncbi:hypothetical protein D9M71_618210 [compost metagenome]
MGRLSTSNTTLVPGSSSTLRPEGRKASATPGLTVHRAGWASRLVIFSIWLAPRLIAEESSAWIGGEVRVVSMSRPFNSLATLSSARAVSGKQAASPVIRSTLFISNLQEIQSEPLPGRRGGPIAGDQVRRLVPSAAVEIRRRCVAHHVRGDVVHVGPSAGLSIGEKRSRGPVHEGHAPSILGGDKEGRADFSGSAAPQ